MPAKLTPPRRRILAYLIARGAVFGAPGTMYQYLRSRCRTTHAMLRAMEADGMIVSTPIERSSDTSEHRVWAAPEAIDAAREDATC